MIALTVAGLASVPPCVIVKTAMDGIEGMVGAVLSCVLMLIAYRCLLHDTKSCWPVGWGTSCCPGCRRCCSSRA